MRFLFRCKANGFLKKLFFLCLAPILPAVVTGWVSGGLPAIDNAGLLDDSGEERPLLAEGHVWVSDVMAEESGKWFWVDARSQERFRNQHIPGAIWCSEDNWSQGMDNLLAVWDGHRHIIVYCDGLECGASESVAKRLIEELGLGLNQVSVLHGGWDAYRAWEYGRG